ncbi:MAG: BMP family ABC transporter substrate-binding protein [Acidimicrobiia bacterium]|nr:BMP family ABC transporter substrate-binding protein [Acidimicrobiia bacterium]
MANQSAGDLGPIDDLVRGLGLVEADFGADTTFIEATDPSTFETILRNLANQGTDIIAVTFPPMQEVVTMLAPEFPDTRWIHVFGFEGGLDNLVSGGFDYYKGTYLAGILAGELNTTGKVGFVGGASIPPLNADYNAFVAAAQTKDPSITGEAAFADSFEDPAKGRELGAALYDGGVDIIMTDAAATDLGVIQAAEEKGGYVVGGSLNYFDSPNVIGSVLLYWAETLYNQVENALSDDYTPGYVGAGVAEGGVDMVISPTFLESGPPEMVELIEATLPEIDAARAAIKDGSLEVPFNPEL